MNCRSSSAPPRENPPLDGDGRRHRDAYQISGNIRTGEGKFILFAKVFAPGITAPVISPRIEVPIEQRTTGAKQLAMAAAAMLRCTATASDSSGSQITVLPEAAIRPWAQFCQMPYSGQPYAGAVARGYLQAVLKVAPDFANGWANLAEITASQFDEPGADFDATRAAVRKAFGRALEIDPDNQKGLIFKALNTLGIFGADHSTSLLSPLSNFAEFDRLALLANNVRPSDCGCEAIIYAQMLRASGRLDASLLYDRKVIANDPSNVSSRAQMALTIASLGRLDEARHELEETQKSWPDSKRTRDSELLIAVGVRDWPKVRTLLPLTDDFPGKDKVLPLKSAAEARNGGAIDAAAQPLIGFLGKNETFSPILASLLVAAGQDAAVAQALPVLIRRNGMLALGIYWLPGMDPARARPEFAAVVKALNLPGYWRLAGHRPDVCKRPAPEAFCASI